MWHQTKVTEILGIRYPILQGPFGGNLSSTQLVAAVSEAGGLGGYGVYTNTPQEIADIDKQIRNATNKPYNLNLWVSDTDATEGTDSQYKQAVQLFGPYFEELGLPIPPKPEPYLSRFENQLQTILDIQPRVFSYMFGKLTADIIAECHRKNIITIGTATTLDEALALEATGTDLIIASGFEAGGHRPSFLDNAATSATGTFVLVQLIREKVKTPVIAAGGIATGAGIKAAMTLGAEAVQIGTAFLACEESNALPLHREMLFSEKAKYTTLTRAFSGRLGRGISNRISAATIGKEDQILPFPLQRQFMSSLRKGAIDKQKWDMLFFWGGQIAPILKHRKAAVLMEALIKEATALFTT
ncbi:nitronate monooxygenase family protein [Chitinophaga sp. Cy-1792]|uniref:NAD(P)H-dependent flavin oxidoreductase n=1 Tax=Chitinophaga sp. Cy-1792 TaxID=2608339 RepID=UPI00141F288E|nr:nitronate monooxygenase [Chitinophaga sp. Cy-1792]NIG54690.1 nitronate monooxygenase [Chitinophaga sp. Cy-1792]